MTAVDFATNSLDDDTDESYLDDETAVLEADDAYNDDGYDDDDMYYDYYPWWIVWEMLVRRLFL